MQPVAPRNTNERASRLGSAATDSIAAESNPAQVVCILRVWPRPSAVMDERGISPARIVSIPNKHRNKMKSFKLFNRSRPGASLFKVRSYH